MIRVRVSLKRAYCSSGRYGPVPFVPFNRLGAGGLHYLKSLQEHFMVSKRIAQYFYRTPKCLMPSRTNNLGSFWPVPDKRSPAGACSDKAT